MFCVFTHYLFPFFLILSFTAIASVTTDLLPDLGCIRAAIKMHVALMKGIMRAPLTFFDTTPAGRILSRFSSDVYIIDSELPDDLSGTIYCIFEVKKILDHENLKNCALFKKKIALSKLCSTFHRLLF